MRQHSLKTSNLIHKKLIENETVMGLIPEENIYLCAADANTNYPYAVIRRTGIQSETGNKDFSGDIVSFTINVFSDEDNYDLGVDITDAIRFALEGWILEYDNIRLENIQLTSASEDWVSDAYMQSISFRAEVVKPNEN